MLKIKYVIPALILALILMAAEIIIIRSASGNVQKVKVVFAAEKIPAGTIITDSMVKAKYVDENAVHKLSLSGEPEAVGKAACTDIEQDEMIMYSKLEDPGAVNSISTQDPDARLFSVEFRTDQANGWQLKPGDFVDIIFIPQKTQAREETGQGEGDVIEDLADRVVRIDNAKVAAIIDESGSAFDSTAGGTVPRYVSFEIKKGQDEFLAYAKACGRIELSVNLGKTPGGY